MLRGVAVQQRDREVVHAVALGDDGDLVVVGLLLGDPHLPSTTVQSRGAVSCSRIRAAGKLPMSP